MTMQLNNDLSICSDKITSSSEMFGDQETLELMDILAQYLGRSNALFSYFSVLHSLTFRKIPRRQLAPMFSDLYTSKSISVKSMES